jgi:hypothetical protein
MRLPLRVAYENRWRRFRYRHTHHGRACGQGEQSDEDFFSRSHDEGQSQPLSTRRCRPRVPKQLQQRCFGHSASTVRWMAKGTLVRTALRSSLLTLALCSMGLGLDSGGFAWPTLRRMAYTVPAGIPDTGYGLGRIRV